MMSKVKGMLEKDMMENPELYNGHAEEDFWMQCRKEELLEREGKPTIKLIRKGKHVKRKRKKSNKV
tara:strand:+ start:919 stop:1116 length:198 start_codon:yes stop_codon:yes gene_type:complete